MDFISYFRRKVYKGKLVRAKKIAAYSNFLFIFTVLLHKLPSEKP